MENTINVRIKQKHGLNSYWSSHIDFIPLHGELIIYDDHKVYTDENDIQHSIPGFKIGDGATRLFELPFVDEALEQQILEHINNTEVHLQKGERDDWNDKVSATVEGELAIFE